jgi:hypothetical protein
LQQYAQSGRYLSGLTVDRSKLQLSVRGIGCPIIVGCVGKRSRISGFKLSSKTAAIEIKHDRGASFSKSYTGSAIFVAHELHAGPLEGPPDMDDSTLRQIAVFFFKTDKRRLRNSRSDGQISDGPLQKLASALELRDGYIHGRPSSGMREYHTSPPA